MMAAALPKIGSAFQGGIYAGLTTGKDGAPYTLILLADKPAKDLPWKKAMAWAKDLEADLPNRVEGALLFANLKDRLDPTWHWLNEEHSASYAWVCYFTYGYQYYGHESDEGSAVAVRRLALESFNPFDAAAKLAADSAARLRSAATALLAACDAADAAVSSMETAS